VAGANILKAMTQEETDELLASITPPDPTPTVEVIAQVDGPVAGQDDVEKKGAKFSADTKKKIAAAMEALKALGADDESSEKLDAPTLDEDAISKLKTEWEAAYTGDRVSKITAERDGLVAEVATLREEAAKSEAALADVVKAMKVKGFLRLVDKATDGAPIAKAEGASDEGADTTDPLAAIRKVHSSGGVVINARG
jgi:hypothetical protein